MEADEPMIYSVHGTADDVVPYLDGESNETGVYTEGSGLIHPVADQVGLINELNAIEGGNHGAFLLCSDCETKLRHFVYENL